MMHAEHRIILTKNDRMTYQGKERTAGTQRGKMIVEASTL